jgi:hypothetical protein
LAVAGFGWRSGEHCKPSDPELVFCNIDELTESHPAWNQLAEIKMLLAQPRQIDNVRPAAPPSVDVSLSASEPTVLSEPRSALQARLVIRAQEETDRFGAQLNSAIDQQLSEKRQELESQVQASEAEERRHYEEDYAKTLRLLSEKQHFDRVDAAIKLAAIKSQLSSGITPTERMKKIVDGCESTLCELQTNLAREQEALKQRTDSDLSQSIAEDRLAIERELTKLRNQEFSRVNGLIRSKNERLLSELHSDSGIKANLSPSGRRNLPVEGIGTTKIASKRLFKANSSFMRTADSSVAELKRFEQDLEVRIRTELEVNIRRIAVENGFKVTFTPDRKLNNKTDWFRSRLPFEVGKKPSHGRAN